MISLKTAQTLKNAGLTWEPTLYDFFAIPDVDMDDRKFVISDMMAEITILKGWPAITFNGVVEWSLDYILQMEVVWLPREDQLRSLIEARSSTLKLHIENEYTCTVEWDGEQHAFTAGSAPDAYAAALVFLLDKDHTQ